MTAPYDVWEKRIMDKMSACFVSTDHLTERLWFRDDNDFRAGMNFVAVVAFSLGIPVLAFILMSNHVHFVLACDDQDALRFITEYKRRYSQYYQNQYGERDFLKRNAVDIRPVGMEMEAMERAIAYTQMNCVAANICSDPASYPWGTGSCFFQYHTGLTARTLSTYSARAQKQLLHSHQKLPQQYMVRADEVIAPTSYVKVRFVEQLFRTPRQYNFFLNNSSKAKKRLENKSTPSFRDQSILMAMPDLCYSLFHKKALNELIPEQKSELLKQLRFRFSADAAQLARVLSIPYDEVVGLLESL